ncbi:RNA polymerase sigma factor [Parabacteroides chinchillae]
MKRSSDEAIWELCLKGDKRAFEELYKRFYPLLYNYGCKFSADKDLIRDCIQNLFVRLIQNHRTLSKTALVKGYLLKAFRNHLYDMLKAQSEQKEMFPCIDEILTFESELVLSATDKSASLKYAIMKLAFMELPLRQQEILYLFYVAEVSHADISSAFDINYQSSKNLLYRSLIKFRELYFLKWKEAQIHGSKVISIIHTPKIKDIVNWLNPKFAKEC